MPRFDNHNLHGELYVEYNVVLPLEISPQTRRSMFKPSLNCIMTDCCFLVTLGRTNGRFPRYGVETR